jgi:hypothetical protein
VDNSTIAPYTLAPAGVRTKEQGAEMACQVGAWTRGVIQVGFCDSETHYQHVHGVQYAHQEKNLNPSRKGIDRCFDFAIIAPPHNGPQSRRVDESSEMLVCQPF